MTRKFVVEVDTTADAAYISMSDEAVAETVQVTDDVLVDFDEFRIVAGIELLRIDADIPFQKLIDDCHVHSDDVETLRKLRPSIGHHFRSSSEGTTRVVQGALTSA
ncbi:hypothetical protein DC31_02175 [Microbacterium sp. CH12i]|uniref:DUF2283 domain-containing protein n=1 Tax=Microbacterium sp. CH12i TaxID=1479651 RepID=UPI000461A795|nr:DUF2283 domain-containing protein [Microbacterium sp. CH12i]KDA04902.1 hypothetical protein DC31_02175 [Microbacterium sp. CH12i]